MWKRKTKDEISKEKSSRRIKQAKPLFFIIVIVCSITFYYTKSEYALVAPFCVYMVLPCPCHIRKAIRVHFNALYFLREIYR